MRNRTQRILSLVLALVMILGFGAPVLAQPMGELPGPNEDITVNATVTVNGLKGIFDGDIDIYWRGQTENGDWQVAEWADEDDYLYVEKGFGTQTFPVPETIKDYVTDKDYAIEDLNNVQLWVGLVDHEGMDVDFFDIGTISPELWDDYADELYWTVIPFEDLTSPVDVEFDVVYEYDAINDDEFEIRVVDTEGKGVEDADVYLYDVLRDGLNYQLDENEDYILDRDSDPRWLGVTDARGILVLTADEKEDLAAWAYYPEGAANIVFALEAEHANYDTSSITFVNFATENNKALLVLSNAPTTFKVTVASRDNEVPFKALPGADVTIYKNVGKLYDEPAKGEVLATGKTDLNGEIVFTDIALRNVVQYNMPGEGTLDIEDFLRNNWLVVTAPGHSSYDELLTDDQIAAGEAKVELVPTGGNIFDYVDRIEGDDRYETAVAVARKSFDELNDEYPEHVILATGEDFADALSANGLTKVFGAPILLTRKAGLPDATAEYLREIVDEYGVVNVIIVGGENAVSPEVQADLQYNYSATVSRMAGEDRYETAAQIANFLTTQGKIYYNWNGSALVANGEGFADAIIASLPAAKYGSPILLTRQEALRKVTQETIQDPRQGYEYITVVGGPNVVSELAMSQIRAPKVDRLWGENRYLTSLEALKMYPDATKLYVVSALEYTDALVAAKLAADNNAAILLVNPNEVRAEVVEYLRTSKITDITIIGGTNAISDDVKMELAQILLLKK